jgi:hypothetical protein
MNSHSKLRWSTGLYYPVVIFSSYSQELEARIITELKTAR